MTHGTFETPTAIWVCVDCMLSRESELTDPPDREPWNLIDPDHTVTHGMLWEEHATATDERCDTECDCEYIEFSRLECEGCGSTLGGSRYAYTVWDKYAYTTTKETNHDS